MLEKFNNGSLYIGEITGIVPYSIENIGGGYSVDGNYLGTYKTVLYFDGEKYVDVFWPDLIINVLTNKSLMVSKDGILYSLDKESLVKYTGKIDEEVLKETALKQKQDISKKRLLKRKNKKMKK